MYVHICRAGASSPSSRARCHAERHSAFWRSRDAAGACARFRPRGLQQTLERPSKPASHALQQCVAASAPCLAAPAQEAEGGKSAGGAQSQREGAQGDWGHFGRCANHSGNHRPPHLDGPAQVSQRLLRRHRLSLLPPRLLRAVPRRPRPPLHGLRQLPRLPRLLSLIGRHGGLRISKRTSTICR